MDVNMKLVSSARRIILTLLPRYPFVNAITLLLLLAERASNEKQPPFGATAIYVNVGLMFVCGVAAGFNHGRQFAATVHAFHLTCMSIVIYATDALQYRNAVKLRMSARLLGVAGSFLLYAYFISEKPRPHLLRRVGECLVGVSVMFTTYAVLVIPEDREAFLKLIPFGHVMLFVYGTTLGTIGLCYIPGLFVYDVTIGLALLMAASTVGVDMRMWYWTTRRGLHYWNQVRLIIDNLVLIAGALLYLICAKRELPPLPIEEVVSLTEDREDMEMEETSEKKLN